MSRVYTLLVLASMIAIAAGQSPKGGTPDPGRFVPAPTAAPLTVVPPEITEPGEPCGELWALPVSPQNHLTILGCLRGVDYSAHPLAVCPPAGSPWLAVFDNGYCWSIEQTRIAPTPVDP